MTKTFLLSLLLGIFLSSCNDGDQTAPIPVKPYPVVAAEMKEINGFYSFPTDIAGKNNNQVRSKIQGYIKQVFVEDGQKVTAGQVLFRIETNVQNQNGFRIYLSSLYIYFRKENGKKAVFLDKIV